MANMLQKCAGSFFVLSLFSLSVVHAKSELTVIDSILMMQESKEGKKLAEVIRKKISDFQEYVKKSQDELNTMQQEMSKKAEVLSKEAIQEKMEQLTKKKKDAERAIADKEETLRAEVQREQMKLREKQLTVASKMFEQEDWGLMVDKNAPGVLFVSKGMDKTAEVLKTVDASYEATLVQKKNSTTLAKGKENVTEAKTRSDVKAIKQA